MEINVHDNSKIVEVWLTNSEKQDGNLHEQLKPLYQKYKEQKYLVAVFESGERDLTNSTSDLLRYNRRRMAEQTVQRKRKKKKDTMEQ